MARLVGHLENSIGGNCSLGSAKSKAGLCLYAPNVSPEQLMSFAQNFRSNDQNIAVKHNSSDDTISLSIKEINLLIKKSSYPRGIEITKVESATLVIDSSGINSTLNVGFVNASSRDKSDEIKSALYKLGINTNPSYQKELIITNIDSLDKFLSLLIPDKKYLAINKVLADLGIEIKFIHKPAIDFITPSKIGYQISFKSESKIEEIKSLIASGGREKLPLHAILSARTKLEPSADNEKSRHKDFLKTLENILGVSIRISNPPQFKDGVWYEFCSKPTQEEMEAIKLKLIESGYQANTSNFGILDQFCNMQIKNK